MKDIPNDVSVTFLLNQDEIRSRRNNKFGKKIAEKGEHNLAYRFRPKYDGARFRKVSPKKLVANCNRAKSIFKKNYGYDLKFIFFPWSKHHLTKQVKAVEEAGFTVFGNNFDLPKNFRRHGKGKVERAIKKLSKSKKHGAIIYQNAHNTNVGKDRDWVEHKFEQKGFRIVSLEECITKPETDDEEPAAEPTPEMAAAQQAPTEEEAAEGAASTLTFSAVGVAAVAVLMLVL